MAILDLILENVTFASLSLFTTASLVIYVAILAVSRLYLSPIAHIPGPKLAALTQWYETYFELIAGGGGFFTWRIRKLHEEYGPIVRINPWEVHIDDVEYFETIYAPSAPYSKLKFFENRFNMPTSTFATADYQLHRPRRQAVLPFFSTHRIQGHAPFMQSLVDKICHRMETEYRGKGKILVLNDVYGCLSGDVIANLAFARSYHLIDTPKWESPFTEAVNNLVTTSHFMAHFPWIIPTMNLFPDHFLMALSKTFKPIIEYRREMEQQISDLIGGTNTDAKHSQFDTVFTQILNSKLPPHEKSQYRLQNEAVSVIGAGFETTRWALTVASFHILANPAITARLRQELTEAIPDPNHMPTWTQLQALPYLTACIEEALRLSYGVVQRSPRVSDKVGFTYGAYYIPPGYPVSMDNYHMHHNETVFPDSYTYRPERWLNNPKGPDGVKKLSRYMVAFGRGNRVCLGMPMAYCEIYLTLASLFRRFEMELHETGRADVDCKHDFVTPKARLDSLGVRVMVK